MMQKVMVVVVVMVAVTGLTVTRQENLNHQYIPVPHFHEQHIQETNISETISFLRGNLSVKYFKCRCEGNQAWSGSGCVDAETNVAVTDPDSGVAFVAATDAFAGVTVGDVQCSVDYVKLALDPVHSSENEFTLLPNGALWWHQQEYEYYCIDHILNAEESTQYISWEGRVCLPPPVVPFCCLQSTAVQQYGSSCNNSLHQFSPPIMIDEMPVKWPRVTTKSARTCKKNEKALTFPLNAGESHLSYKSGAVSIVWNTPYYFQETQDDGFCVMPQEGGSYVATICKENQDAVRQNLCGKVTCVRKCCKEGEMHFGQTCIAAQNETQMWTPQFADPDLLTSVLPPPNLTLLYGRPECQMYLADPENYEDDNFYLLENGYLFTPASGTYDPPTHYCIDNFLTMDKEVLTKALICFTEEHVEPVCDKTKLNLYPVLFAISTVFFGATLVIYLSVPDLRDKLHGRCLISLTSAFLVAYSLFCVSYLSKSVLQPAICTTLGFFKQFSLLAAFFWLNVMCFDIWRTLRKTRAISGGRRSLHRFLWYCAYAWGCPLTIAAVTALLEQLLPSSNEFRPNFNNMICWFPDPKTMWLYFYVWISTLMATNLVFFVMVIVILWKGQNNSLLRRSREMNRERMWLYVKLFLVMGVTWVAEMVSYGHGRCVGWVFTDIINALEGLTLFLVFIVNRTTLRKIRTRWKCFGPGMTRSLNTTLTSNSSASSKKHDSRLTTGLKNSTVSGKSSNATTTSELESTIPLNTLKESKVESSQLEATGDDSQPLEEVETSTIVMKDFTSEGT